MRSDNVANLIVENRCRMIELAFLRGDEHQPHAAGIEEREIRRSEKEFHSEHIAVERCRPRHVLHVDRDLSDRVEMYRIAGHFHWVSRPGKSALAAASVIS